MYNTNIISNTGNHRASLNTIATDTDTNFLAISNATSDLCQLEGSCGGNLSQSRLESRVLEYEYKIRELSKLYLEKDELLKDYKTTINNYRRVISTVNLTDKDSEIILKQREVDNLRQDLHDMYLVNAVMLKKQDELISELKECRLNLEPKLLSQQNSVIQIIGRTVVIPLLNFMVVNPIRFLFDLNLHTE